MRTSALGWRIVAFGALVLIFGISALMNDVGPSLLSLVLVVAGVAVIVYGRMH